MIFESAIISHYHSIKQRPLISIEGLRERFATAGKNAKTCVALKYTRPR